MISDLPAVQDYGTTAGIAITGMMHGSNAQRADRDCFTELSRCLDRNRSWWDALDEDQGKTYIAGWYRGWRAAQERAG